METFLLRMILVIENAFPPSTLATSPPQHSSDNQSRYSVRMTPVEFP